MIWCVTVLLTLAGCAGSWTSEGIITDPGGSFVRLDPDPAVSHQNKNAHPASVPLERLRTMLEAIEVEGPSGPLLGLRGKTPLFDPEDLDFLVPAVSQALMKAKESEHLVFYLRQRGRLLRPEVTTGAIAVKGESVYVTVGHYRRTDVEGSGVENREGPIHDELRDDPLYGVHDVGVRFSVKEGQRWQPGDSPRMIVFSLELQIPSPSLIKN